MKIDCFESILAGTYGVLRKNQNVLTELVDFLENTYYTIYDIPIGRPNGRGNKRTSLFNINRYFELL